MRDKMPLKAFATLFLVLPLMMCSDPKAMNEQSAKLSNTIEKQNLLASKIEAFEKSQNEISGNIASIQASITQINNQMKALEQKSAQPANKPPEPGKPLNIAIGDSFVFGPADAKVTITEWMDFQ
ncbi:MAG: hypothetical protein HQ510_03500 [Candidatus Marinimicrobia bacterium]|nr:hypothetical protein [Candidatus Neomarinimicrobiota bacterium]